MAGIGFECVCCFFVGVFPRAGIFIFIVRN
jgi:hypothetical protein